MRKLSVLILLIVQSFLYCEDISMPEMEYNILSTSKGYFNIYINNNEKKPIALFDNGIHENSRIFINDGGTQFSLRDIKPTSIKTPNGGLEIKWILNGIVVNESFIKVNDGYLYTINLLNTTKVSHNISISLVYDTYLGEKEKRHFIIDNEKVIRNENYFLNQNIPTSIKSVNAEGYGIEYNFKERIDFLPSRVILGNWDRLSNRRNKVYTPTNGGSFSYGYYSINDSGIGILYPGIEILSYNEQSYSFKLNIINPEIDKSEVKSEVNTTDIMEDINIESKIISTENIEDVTEEKQIEFKDDSVNNKINDTSEEELNKMLEYIQKRKRGEDVSEYDFDEDYIMMKLKGIDE